MRKKVVLLITLMGICCVSVGVLIGIRLNNNGESATSDIDKIAIVNLDEGIAYNDEERNFGVELIKNIEEEYVVTGLSDAQNGVTNSKYAAYIILPSNLSQNVVSVNTSQEYIKFNYEIAGGLSEEAKEDTIIKVLGFEKKFSKNLSSLYITSILNSYHTGQDGATKVLGNDEIDKTKILAIASSNLVEMVNLSDVKDVDRAIAELNVEEQRAEGERIITDVDTSYKDFLLLSATELANLKVDYTDLDASLSDIHSEISKVPTTFKEDGTPEYTLINVSGYIHNLGNEITKRLNEFNAELATFKVTYDGFKSSYLATDKNAVNSTLELEKAENRIQRQLLWFVETYPYSTISDAVMYYEMSGELDADVKTVMTSAGGWIDPNNNPTLSDYIAFFNNQTVTQNRYVSYNNAHNQMSSIYNNVPTVNVPSAISSFVDDGEGNATILKDLILPSVDVAEKHIKNDLNSLQTRQATQLQQLNSVYSDKKSTSSTILGNMMSYTPEKYIDEKVIQRLIKDFLNNSKDLVKIAEDNNSEHIKYADNVSTTSAEHISNLREDIQNANEKSNQLVETGVEDLKITKTANSIENSGLLNGFIATLPYTRNESLLNTNAVTFIAKPVDMEGTISAKEKEEKMMLSLVFMILGVVTLAGATIQIVRISRKTKEEVV